MQGTHSCCCEYSEREGSVLTKKSWTYHNLRWGLGYVRWPRTTYRSPHPTTTGMGSRQQRRGKESMCTEPRLLETGVSVYPLERTKPRGEQNPPHSLQPICEGKTWNQTMRAAMATAALFTGRTGAFVSSGGLWRHGGITRTTSLRSLSMAEGEARKVGFIGGYRVPYLRCVRMFPLLPALSSRGRGAGGGVCMIVPRGCSSCCNPCTGSTLLRRDSSWGTGAVRLCLGMRNDE